ncbi:serine protease inhibitor dipetalogastin-like [Saccostrea echinata]|uniref:serine protease inhibitor dipetalogastin-like n=1 Tax=Saccostrea echinata TaxID=191078 RepID=UPI002A82EAE2|nr:serine protease inhibitor dipetalogastin-like [Saccostrea echinata]
MIFIFVGVILVALSLSEDSSKESCPRDLTLLCGRDGITYANECYAKRANVGIQDVGPCEENRKCRCNRIMIDVCGYNGIQYNNPCLARCHGVENFTLGKCDVIL